MKLNDYEKEQVKILTNMYEDALKSCEDDCWHVCEICGANGGFKDENLITTSGYIRRICKNCATKGK